MTRPALAIVTSILAASGCMVYGTSGGSGPDPVDTGYVVPNAAPYITFAEAGCYWDDYNRDDIWYFDADVDDADSPLDVVAVYADVYDSYSGAWVDGFDLYPTDDPYYWFSDWLGRSTYLDCYYGGYQVDITATDSFQAYDIVTIAPYTYNYY